MNKLPLPLVNRLVVAAVVLGFSTLMALGGVFVLAVRQNLDFTALVNDTYRVRQAISEYRVLNERVETARRGYLLTGDPSFLEIFEQSWAELPRAADRVGELTASDPDQQTRIAQVRELQIQQIDAARESISAGGAGRLSVLQEFGTDAGVQATRAIRVLMAEMDRAEAERLELRYDAQAQTTENLFLILIVAGAMLAIVAVGSVWILMRYTRDLAVSRDALAALNQGLEDEVRARTADLQRANDEIQRFAYIVSHDLRSPLVNVMGFTSELEAAMKPLNELLARTEALAPEAVSREAREAVSADLPESIAFIRTSTQKMDRLINAILKLSREGRRVLAPEPVDAERLFRGIADTLTHKAGEVGAVIEVEPGAPPIVSDRLALEQIFANLAENALKYLKPGRPGRIVLRGERQGDRNVYEVVDNGRGIDPKDHQRIFDLFRRSGAQDQPGEGIGLAHVRALAYRLGGTVGVESALGEGATFRVSLPRELRLEAAE